LELESRVLLLLSGTWNLEKKGRKKGVWCGVVWCGLARVVESGRNLGRAVGKISIDIGIEGAKWVCKSVGQQEWSVVNQRLIAASSLSSSVLPSSSWSSNEGFCCCCFCCPELGIRRRSKKKGAVVG
jgi:hypothetical protein